MIVVLGEVLFDIFPDGMVIGGAPFNFAYHLKKLGFPVQFVSRIGRDSMGQNILDFILSHGFDPDDIQKDDDHETGTVQVQVTDNGHVFHITPDAAWDHLEFNGKVAELILNEPDVLYFGSLIQRTPNGGHFFKQLAGFNLGHTDVFCDINLRKNAYSRETVQSSMALCDILKLNLDELDKTSIPVNKTNGNFPKKPIHHLMHSHNIKEVILTMGSMGSLWADKNDLSYFGAMVPKPFVDSVGAGDAYAAVAVAGRLEGLPVNKTMALASRFSSYICSIKGALPPGDSTIYTTLKKEIEAG